MTNPWRGDIEIVMNGQPRRMRLTLGALAELEASLKADCLMDIVTRFESGRFSTRDISSVLMAGLRGGGWTGHSAELSHAEISGGPMVAAKAAAQLLARSFGLPNEADHAA